MLANSHIDFSTGIGKAGKQYQVVTPLDDNQLDRALAINSGPFSL